LAALSYTSFQYYIRNTSIGFLQIKASPKDNLFSGQHAENKEANAILLGHQQKKSIFLTRQWYDSLYETNWKWMPIGHVHRLSLVLCFSAVQPVCGNVRSRKIKIETSPSPPDRSTEHHESFILYPGYAVWSGH
jgi:hypothetical protein